MIASSLHPLCLRLELAQVLQNRSILEAYGASACGLALEGGFAHFYEAGHPLNQALALGLAAPLSEGDLDRIEALLGQGGHPVVLEVSAGVDPALLPLLAQRGYRIQAFQQVFARELAPGDSSPVPSWRSDVQVRLADPDHWELWGRVVSAGFQDADALDEPAPDFCLATARAAGNHVFLAWMGDEPIGAATLGIFNGVGVLSGTSVRPSFRGHGAQRALVAFRLARAVDSGCTEACSAALAGSASQANLERCGFRVAYPKLEMALDPK